METPNQEWERHIEQRDWETLGISNEEEVIGYRYICNYCRKQVSPDIGQVEIFCPHCEMITQAVKEGK